MLASAVLSQVHVVYTYICSTQGGRRSMCVPSERDLKPPTRGSELPRGLALSRNEARSRVFQKCPGKKFPLSFSTATLLGLHVQEVQLQKACLQRGPEDATGLVFTAPTTLIPKPRWLEQPHAVQASAGRNSREERKQSLLSPRCQKVPRHFEGQNE